MFAAACATDEPPPSDEVASAPIVDNGEAAATAPAEATLGLDETDDGSGSTQTPPPPSVCGIICAAATAEATADCAEFAVGAPACGIATYELCEAVCNSRGPRSHCTKYDGSKGCMNEQYMWWCDRVVDGRSVRMRYELRLTPGVVATVAAPRRACQTVRWPTTRNVKRWQLCTDGKGCSGWFFP